uniref:Histamine H1 receptor n=1 Tax=Pogona vitticeps TaxID=103695 RepID=A0A6J0UG84_9SAUR
MCVIDRDTENSTQIQPVIGLVLGSISLITVVMNILVLYAVKTEKKLQTVGNLYIVSLSCADVIVGAAVMPLNIVYLLKDKWILARKACLFWLSMDYVASTASIFSLFILCIDRYRSVQQPLKYLKYRTKTRASIMISVAWLLSFMWVIPILGWRKFTNYHNTTSRTDDEKICETDFCKTTWFKVLTAMINFYVPSLLMLWFYAKIYKAVRRHCKHRELINGSFRSVQEKASTQSEKLQEMQKGYLLNAHKDTGYVTNENDSDENKGMEVKYPANRFIKISKSDRDNDVGVVKLDCFPPASVEDVTGIGNTDSKYACVKENIETKETLCSLDYEFSKMSEGLSFAEGPSSRRCSTTLKQYSDAGRCFSRSSERKDSTSLHYLKRTWERLCTQSINRSQGNREKKAAKQLGVIMATFILCWIPYFVLFLVMAYCEKCYNRPVHMFTIWLGYVNSTLNPFIYPLCNENFKKAFKKIFHIKN